VFKKYKMLNHTYTTLCTRYVNEKHSVDMQVYERAMEVHGSEEDMEKARLKKVERREKQQQKKFDKNVQGKSTANLSCAEQCREITVIYLLSSKPLNSIDFFHLINIKSE